MKLARTVLLWVLDALLLDVVLFFRVLRVAKKEGIRVQTMPKSLAELVADWRSGTYSMGTHNWSGKAFKSSGLIKYSEAWIELHPLHCLNPWVLAHELGHHLAVPWGNRSEEAAHSVGNGIVRSVLSKVEVEASGWRVDYLLPPLPEREVPPPAPSEKDIRRAEKYRSSTLRGMMPSERQIMIELFEPVARRVEAYQAYIRRTGRREADYREIRRVGGLYERDRWRMTKVTFAVTFFTIVLMCVLHAWSVWYVSAIGFFLPRWSSRSLWEPRWK